MPNSRLERLIFIQGGNCFFCKSPLPRSEASIEHLFAKSNGGGNDDENCVACCKLLNAILGSMPLKAKFQVVLNQKGNFICPGAACAGDAADAVIVKAKLPLVTRSNGAACTSPIPDHFALVVANLRQRASTRPRTLKTLKNSLASLFPKGVVTDAEISAIIEKLQSSGAASIEDGKVSYAL